MKVTILGSGTSVPHPKRSSSAYWIETAGGNLLLDLSPSAIHRMAQEGHDWAKLDSIWISHFHLDHCGGLPAFLFGTKHAPQLQKRTRPLRIFGPVGLRKLIENFDSANSYGLLEQPFPLDIIEVEALEPFEIVTGVTAVAMKTPHSPESHAIHLRDEKDRTLAFSADTGYHEPLAALAGRSDLFILECSFVENKPFDGHLEFADAIHLIRKAEPKVAVLTHLYPEWDDADMSERLSAFAGETKVLAAWDGLRIDLTK